MIEIEYNPSESEFHGKCPRCGERGFFRPLSESMFENIMMKIVKCSGGHMFCVEHHPQHPNIIFGVFPVEFREPIPTWLPPEYRGAFVEMYDNYHNKRYRSSIAIASVLLDAFLNSILPNEGEKKKMLFLKIEAAKNLGKIDNDQFSDATITRLTRNGILHPESILEDIPATDADEAIRAVTLVIERAHKFRSSRALPAATEK